LLLLSVSGSWNVLLCAEIHDAANVSVQNLTVLREHCIDPALSVRKQALQSLTDLLDSFPLNATIQKCVLCNYWGRL